MSEQEDVKRILVAADGSPQSIKAVRLAAKITKATGAELAIVHVNEMHELPTLIAEGQNPDEELRGQVIINDALEIAISEGVKANGVIKFGHAGRANPGLCPRIFPPLIFMGTRGMGRALAMVMGSVSQVVCPWSQNFGRGREVRVDTNGNDQRIKTKILTCHYDQFCSDGREILDSRGNPDYRGGVKLANGITARAASPSGASTGSHEASGASEIMIGIRFGGRGVFKP